MDRQTLRDWVIGSMCKGQTVCSTWLLPRPSGGNLAIPQSSLLTPTFGQFGQLGYAQSIGKRSIHGSLDDLRAQEGGAGADDLPTEMTQQGRLCLQCLRSAPVPVGSEHRQRALLVIDHRRRP